jgi:hypothetical protein
MGDDFDPSIIGRRVADGDNVSFREAVKMFATKDELTAMGTGIRAIASQVAAFVTRSEHETRWERDDEFRRDTKKALEELKAQRLPQWLFMALGPLAAIAIALLGKAH